MADFSREALALSWSTRNMSAQDWNDWCLKYVANAYGKESAGYNTATEAATALGVAPRPNSDAAGYGLTSKQKSDILAKTKIGDLVFFEATSDNSAGHVGIYAGNGKMQSATPNGVREEDVLGTAYNSARFRGTAPAPKEWSGTAATPEIIEGARKFQSVIESSRMASNVTTAAKEQVAGLERQIREANEAIVNAKKVTKPKNTNQADLEAYNSAQQTIQQANELLKALPARLDAAKIAYAKAQDDDVRAAGTNYNPTNDKGQRLEDVALAAASLKHQQAEDAYNDEQDPATKEAKRVQRDLAKTELAAAQKRLDLIGQPAPRTPEQVRDAQLDLQIKEALVRSGLPQAQAEAELARIRAATPSSKAIETQEALGGVNLEKAQFELGELKRKAALDPNNREFDLRIKQLEQVVAAGETKNAYDAKRYAPGGSAELIDDANAKIAQSNVDEANAKAAFEEKKKYFADLVSKGQLLESEALAGLGDFAGSLKAQLDQRREIENERRNRALEADKIAEENRSLAELASEQISNAQGSAIMRNRGSNYGDPNRPATTFNPGGDPSQSPAQRVLAGLGLSMRSAPAATAPDPSKQFSQDRLQTAMAGVPRPTVQTRPPVEQAVPVQPATGVPAFDYSAVQAGRASGVEGQPPGTLPPSFYRPGGDEYSPY